MRSSLSFFFFLGTPSKKTRHMSYSVTFSLKVGGGQDQIIPLEAAKIVTSK